MSDKGGGGSKILEKDLTSFKDGPLGGITGNDGAIYPFFANFQKIQDFSFRNCFFGIGLS